MIGFRNGREVGASLVLQPFFLLGNQIVRVYHHKDRLITLSAVSYEVCGGIFSQVARNQPGNHRPTIFFLMAVG